MAPKKANAIPIQHFLQKPESLKKIQSKHRIKIMIDRRKEPTKNLKKFSFVRALGFALGKASRTLHLPLLTLAGL
jgi:hypothetical protein